MASASETADAIAAAGRCLASASRIAVLTGAGISAESGVPTFRDAAEGLWARYDPRELATPEAFARDAGLAWRWYRWRRTLVGEAAPNAGHEALAALADRVPSLTLITQNVDGLHQRAGSRDVLEFHGNLFEDKCLPCGVRQSAAVSDETAPLPRCPQCGEVMTPGVVLFGEPIPDAVYVAAEQAATTCDAFLVIGTSAEVYPAAGLAQIARHADARIIEINPAETPLSSAADLIMRGPAGTLLPAALAAMRGSRQ